MIQIERHFMIKDRRICLRMQVNWKDYYSKIYKPYEYLREKAKHANY